MLCFAAFLLVSGKLASWLEQKSGDLNTNLGIDSKGLRGLRRSDVGNNIACSIPQGCAILADPKCIGSRHFKRPIDLLSCTLLSHLRRGQSDYFAPYLESLPHASDIALSTLGSRWSDRQLERLRYPEIMSKLKTLRHHRNNFIKKMSSIETEDKINELAGWAYDLASSRALEGHFGQNGVVRNALLCFLVAIIFAMSPFISFSKPVEELNNQVILPLQNIIPLLPTSAFLIHALSKRNNEIAMLPWIDLGNHKSGNAMSFEYDILHDNIILKEDADTNILASNNKWVTYDYGGVTGINNDRLLGEYGFIEIDNPNDTFELDIVHGETVILGRHGVILDRANQTNEKILHAAINIRKVFAERFNSDVDFNDPFDIECAAVAQLWRQEKVRLIDEFMKSLGTTFDANHIQNNALVGQI